MRGHRTLGDRLARPPQSHARETPLPSHLLIGLHATIRASCHLLQTHFIAWTTPPRSGLVQGLARDLARRKTDVVAEHALLRQQLLVLS